MDSLPKTVTRQRRGCDLNPGLSALESSTLTTRLASHPVTGITLHNIGAWTLTPSIEYFWLRHWTAELRPYYTKNW